MWVGGSSELSLSLQLKELDNNIVTYDDECTIYVFIAGQSDQNKNMAWLLIKDIPDL